MPLFPRWLLLLNVMWFAACATAPRTLDEGCVATERQGLAGQFALNVVTGQGSQQLLVVSEWQQGQLQILGFNAIGAKLFSGQLAGGTLDVEASRLYRGPDAGLLLWGLLVHQLGGELPVCWHSSGYQLLSDTEQIRLQRDGETLYLSRASNEFKLPAQKITIQVQRLN